MIASINPGEANVASAVTISGSGFGATQASNSGVTFNGKPATPLSWSSDSIVVEVPNGATTGNVVVTASGIASAGVSFTVDSGTPSNCMVTTATTNTLTLGNEFVLHGTYAYSVSGFQGASPGTRFERAGSFFANGAGAIGTGVEDYNLGAKGDVQLTIVSSSYAIGPDLRGCMTLNYKDMNGDMTSATYRFSLGTIGGIFPGVASRGHIIEFDDANGGGSRGSGILLQQSTGDFNSSSLGANYSFGLQGVNNTGGRVSQTGTFKLAAASGTISAGYLDYDNAGSLMFSAGGTNGLSTGTIATAGNSINTTTGRTTATFVAENGCTCTYHWAVYVVNHNEFLAMSTDALAPNTPLVAGRIAVALSNYPAAYLSSASSDGYIVEATGATAGAASALLEQLAFTSTAVSGAQWTYANGMGGAMNAIASTPYSQSSAGSARFTFGNTVLYLVNPTATDGIIGFFATQDLSTSAGLVIPQNTFAFSAGGNSHYFFGSINMADANVRNQIGSVGTIPNASGPSVGIGGATDQNAATAATALSSSTFSTTLTVSSSNGATTGSDGNGGQIVGVANGSSLFYIDETGDAAITVLEQ